MGMAIIHDHVSALLGSEPDRAGPADEALSLPNPIPIPIVAIGASAGGLEAASKLFDALTAQTGAAFILVQHLDPSHDSLLVELLAKHTAMPVVQAADGEVLAADHLYIIPPAHYLAVHAGAIQLSVPRVRRGARLPFDFLLRSLADEPGRQAACVVLSGAGGDGSLEIPTLHASGGFVIVQEPEEAEYDGMPRSAIATGLVDAILPLAGIPQSIADFLHRSARLPDGEGGGVDGAAAGAQAPASLAAIIALLKDKTSHDFGQYKPGTLERRIERRMGLLGLTLDNRAGYLELLVKQPAERDALAKDLLINVTSFFRDPKVFEMLEKTTIPELIQGLPKHQPLRIWVAGCSTGEEAYSIAMVCQTAIADAKREIKLQVFASDTDPDAIATARDGLYSLDIAATMAPDRLARFFIREDAGYRVIPSLRSTVVFTVQDVLSDPPFSRIDMVSCRNLLIYLNPEAQAKVIALFHFALREGGILLLGAAETVGSAQGRFEQVAKAERLYRHIARSRAGDRGLPFPFGEPLPLLATSGAAPSATRQGTLADICNRNVLATHAPAAVLINRNRQCLYSSGPTERYLRIAPGYATLDILAMASPAMRTKLRRAIDKAGKSEPRVDGGRTRLTQGGHAFWFRIDVQWLAAEGEDMLLVCFVEEANPQAPAPASKRGDGARIAVLERELEAAQAELHSAIQDQEVASQEQKAVNEEALSVNEEFQSTNEELLTSKEELQSLNEELSALNSQLQETLERQRLTSDDLQNVLYSTDVGTLFLDADLKIRFFTPAIRALFSIIPGDVGRPLSDLHSNATDPDLVADARKVLAGAAVIEREIHARGGTWFVRRIFPYRAHDNHVEGVVITFADISELKVVSSALEAAKLEAERANRAKSRFLAAASHDLRQPLQSLTLLQALLAQTVEGEKSKGLVARLDQSLGAMSGMLNALLDINQIEAGLIEPKPRAFPVGRLRDEFTYLAQAQGLSLHILPHRAIIRSDPHMLEQMLRNLLGNALKYTNEGKILLGCRRRGAVLRIQVWDTGIGMPAEELSAIFDEFHQVGNAARERSQGLGLGLSIVQRVGKLLGHEVGVRSVPGKGSVFSIDVACPKGDAPAAVMPESAGLDSPAGRHRCKIVIVDDDPDVLALLKELLKARGHIVRTASDAGAALKLIAAGAIRPEILLTDYNLPGGMNGLELLAELRGTLNFPLPAIVLTGDISREALAAIAATDCIHLSKPIKLAALAKAIERLVPFDPSAHPPADPVTDAKMVAKMGGERVPVTYVVDDDRSVRETIREVLEGEGRAVRDYESAEKFLAVYDPDEEGCLLVDAHLPGMTGVALVDELRRRGDHMPAILMTGSSDIGLAVSAIRTGARDFVEKPVSRDELAACIAHALDQSHEIRLVDAAQEMAARRLADLTSRQREVMDMILTGHPSKNIAADLGISQRTVENHRAAVMARMGANSMPELARMAQAAAAHLQPELP
jgi:two-component system CheB/CheR fusion protein